jgi:hypothetical protein
VRPHRLLALAAAPLAFAACAAPEVDSGASVNRFAEGLSGCHGHATTYVPASHDYVLTTFGASASDDGIMSCGSYTKHGSWYYAASRQRYGCGARVKVEAQGKCVVVQTDDYGPDECVEKAAGAPILDASPLVAMHLYGRGSAGWSDRLTVHVSPVAGATPLGPCDGGASQEPPPPATGCYSSTLARQVEAGTCVQSAADGAWYHCQAGEWRPGAAGCTATFAWCRSSTLGRDVPPRTCVESRNDHTWYQCNADGWDSPVESGAGPAGSCSAEYAL